MGSTLAAGRAQCKPADFDCYGALRQVEKLQAQARPIRPVAATPQAASARRVTW